MIIITFTYRHRKEIIIGIIIFIVLSLLITAGAIYYLKLEKNNKKEDIIVDEKNELVKQDEETKEKLKEIFYKVDIKGQILTPGIYTMKPSSRVIDQTTSNMIQKLNLLFARKPLISKGI